MLDRNHIAHYLVIIGIVVLGAVSITFLSPNKDMQLLAAVAMSIMYLFYGIVHHSLEHDLTIKIVIEYVLVAVLVIVLFVFVRGGF